LGLHLLGPGDYGGEGAGGETLRRDQGLAVEWKPFGIDGIFHVVFFIQWDIIGIQHDLLVTINMFFPEIGDFTGV